MTILGRRRFEGTHRGGRHEAKYQVSDASQDNFSYDPYNAGRRADASPAVSPEAPVRPAIEASTDASALAAEQPAIGTELGESYVPAASNIRPEIPTGRHDTGEQAIIKPDNYEARHAAPADANQEWYATNEHRLIEPEGNIVGQIVEVPVVAHEGVGDRSVLGSREWQLAQDDRVQATEVGADADPNVIGSAAWRTKGEAALTTPREPGVEYNAADDANVIGSAAWQRRKDAMLEAHRDDIYGSEPKWIDHSRPEAATPTPVQVENNNILARVYNNVRSHKRNQGRHAAVSTGRRFSFLSRGKGRHRA